MLHSFIEVHRDEIIRRARERVMSRRVPLASPGELSSGVPKFLDLLGGLLREAQGSDGSAPIRTVDVRADEVLGDDADRGGDAALRAGLTVAQVVEGYGDVCQAITEQAIATDTSITGAEYQTLNLSLDVATARAVTAFARERDAHAAQEHTERLGELAHELRNLLSTAVLSYEALRRGAVGMESRTGAMLGRSLRGLRDLVDRSLAEVRLATSLHHPQRIQVAQLLEDIEVGAMLDARERGLELSVPPIDPALFVQADLPLLASAVANVLQNAIKYTRASGRVSVNARADADHLLIDVEDECGGLPAGKAENLFAPFDSRDSKRTGLGLGLKISHDAVRANGGEIRVRDMPGKGCVFTIDVPLAH